jgi:hypothetical protein
VKYNYGFCSTKCRDEAAAAKKYIPKKRRTAQFVSATPAPASAPGAGTYEYGDGHGYGRKKARSAASASAASAAVPSAQGLLYCIVTLQH